MCKAVNSELNLIAKSNPHSPCILISALAEGADRLVASCALSLGWQLCAVLPLTQDDYETDFHDDESVAEFRELLKRSTWVKVLDAKHHLRPGCYHELGLWLSQQAQVLIALWDGEQAKGPGGTAEVIQHFREGVALAQPILPDSGPVICGQDDSADRLLAAHPNANSNLLAKLSESRDDIVRKNVLAHKNTSQQTLQQMSDGHIRIHRLK